MADTTFERSSGETAPTQRQDPAKVETWHPPQSLWRLYFLSVLTLGLWLCYWARGVAEDLNRNRDAGFDPAICMIGLPVPFLGWRLLRDLARAIHVLENPYAKDGRRFALLATLCFTTLLLFYAIGLIGLFTLGPSAPQASHLVGLSLLALPLPILVLQRRLNRFKAGLQHVLWTGKPYRFNSDEVVLLAVMGGVMLSTTVTWLWQETGSLGRWTGEALAASEPVSGESGLYSLTPPDGDWMRVGNDQFYEGTDLSLLGPGTDTKVFVWVKCNGESIEDRVRFRRGKWDGADGRVDFAERRQLLERPFLPISYVHYEAIWRGTPSLSFVATIAQGDVLVEVIGEAHPESDHRGSMEALVRSLLLDEEATSCGGS